MGKRFASFYRCLAFARFWKEKFWRSFIKCEYLNDGWTDFPQNIYLYIFILGFFRKPEKLGFHTGSKWWPGDPDVKDDSNDPLTRWPNDPVPCLDDTTATGKIHGKFLAWSLHTSFLRCKQFSHLLETRYCYSVVLYVEYDYFIMLSPTVILVCHWSRRLQFCPRQALPKTHRFGMGQQQQQQQQQPLYGHYTDKPALAGTSS